MPGKSTYLKNLWLNFVLRGVDAPTLVRPTVSGGIGNWSTLSLALHTAEPTTSSAASNEVTGLTGYNRFVVMRDTPWGSVSNGTFTATGYIELSPITSGGPVTATHFSISSGNDSILYEGTLTPPVVLKPGVAVRIPASSFTITER